MDKNLPPTLGYATPQSRLRHSINWNTVSIAIALIQFSMCCICLGSLGDNAPARLGGPLYLKIAVRWFLGPYVMILYAVGSTAILFVALFVPRTLHPRLYRFYAAVWAAVLLLTEITIAINQQWPGERTHRWVLVHNMATVDSSPALFIDVFGSFVLANPVLWCLALAALANFVQRPAARAKV